jgi:hypothetical protein
LKTINQQTEKQLTNRREMYLGAIAGWKEENEENPSVRDVSRIMNVTEDAVRKMLKVLKINGYCEVVSSQVTLTVKGYKVAYPEKNLVFIAPLDETLTLTSFKAKGVSRSRGHDFKIKRESWDEWLEEAQKKYEINRRYGNLIKESRKE